MTDTKETGIIAAIRRWYMGTDTVIEGENWSNDRVSVITLPQVVTDYHWTAKVVRRLVRFYLDHWQWIIGTGVATVLGILALK